MESASAFYVFAAIFDLNWISTVPATTALTARIFGSASVGTLPGWILLVHPSVGTLSGWILLAHQVGAALGAAAGGWIFEATGAYTWAFISAAAELAFLATGLTFAIQAEPIDRTPVARPPPWGPRPSERDRRRARRANRRHRGAGRGADPMALGDQSRDERVAEAGMTAGQLERLYESGAWPGPCPGRRRASTISGCSR